MCSTLIDGLDYGHEIKLGQERRHLEEVSREAEVQLPHVWPSVCRVSSALGAPGEAHSSMTADVVSRAGLASLFPCLTELRALSLLPSLAPEPLGFYTTVTGTHVPAQIPGPRLATPSRRPDRLCAKALLLQNLVINDLFPCYLEHCVSTVGITL